MSETSTNAVVIDAGVGNLGNLERALRRLGAEVEITNDAATVAEARCLLLPGVGAFTPPREQLRGDLEAALGQALEGGGWLLGICVGFQLLFEASEEFGDTDGLGLLPGTVTRLPDTVPLPHIGWNRLLDLPKVGGDHRGRENGGGVTDPEHRPETALMAGLEADSHVYFVHTFAPEGVPEELILATTLHGRSFPAVVGRGRVLGTQFHPEKSGVIGLRLLENFLEMARGTDGPGDPGRGGPV